MRGCLRQLGFLSLLALLFLGVVFGVASMFQPPSASAESVRVEVPRHATVRTIAERLEEKGLIRHRYAFMLMARIMGESNNLKAGEYELQPRMPLLEIIDKLARGDATAVWFTVPEGYTVSQVADTLTRLGMVEHSRFMRLAASDGARFEVGVRSPRASLEGYLFPDSYKFKKGVGASAIIRGMLRNFHDQVVEGLRDQIHANDLPLDKIIILASLIEREARVPEDRPLISAVIRNRLQRHMLLQIDASVLYALGHHKERVLLTDLQVDSPYNTYRYAGMPPGPICSPGLDSIKAALNPARVNYLYYVARPDGHHVFSTTLSEHNANVKRARAGES
jgi:peptidoglycan lytic transglycosylase G